MLNRHDFSIEGTFHAQAENGLLGVRRVRTLPKLVAELPKLLRNLGWIQEKPLPRESPWILGIP